MTVINNISPPTRPPMTAPVVVPELEKSGLDTEPTIHRNNESIESELNIPKIIRSIRKKMNRTNWSIIKNKALIKIVLKSTVVFLLTVPKRFNCCGSSLFVCLGFNMWCLFCPYLYLSLSFGISWGFCFVIVALAGYLYLYCSYWC